MEKIIRALVSCTEVEMSRDGGLAPWTFTGDGCGLVTRGELDMWQVDRYGGPRTQGEFLHSRNSDMPHEVAARGDATVLLFSLQELWKALGDKSAWGRPEERIAQLLGYSSTRAAIRTAAEIESATFQAFPGARAVVLPGPYKADRVTQFNIPLKKDPLLEALLPPRVKWHQLAPFALFFVARFSGFGPAQPDLMPPSNKGAAYHEAGMMIPTQIEGSSKMRLYVPWIFPTSLMAMFAGREIYGYPKTWATIQVNEQSLGAGRLMVRRGGITLADIEYEPIPGLTTLSNLGTRIGAPVVTKLMPQALKSIHVACHKRLWNGVAREASPEIWNPTFFSVDQIALSGFDIGTVKRVAPIHIKESTLRLAVSQGAGRSPKVFPLETVGGMATRVEYGMVMTTGNAPVDYLGPTTDLSGSERARLAPEPMNVAPQLRKTLSSWYGNWGNRDS